MSTGIGEALRAARRQQGRSLADAAAATRVRESYLAALEEEEFAALGGDVYVKGFLRSYARFLGLNPEPLLEEYRREHERGEEQPPLTAGRPIDPDGRRGLSPLAVLAAIALTVFALYTVLSRGDEAPPTVPAPSPVETETGVPADTPVSPGDVDPGAPGDADPMDPNAPAVEPTGTSGARSGGDGAVHGIVAV